MIRRHSQYARKRQVRNADINLFIIDNFDFTLPNKMRLPCPCVGRSIAAMLFSNLISLINSKSRSP